MRSFSCTVIQKVHNFAPIKFIQTMKNKLFLALALAGAVACDKEKPVTPNNNANDLSAQIQNLLNSLDPTQAQEIKDALVPDEAMKTFLLEGQDIKKWDVVDIASTLYKTTNSITNSWTNGYSSSNETPFHYADHVDFKTKPDEYDGYETDLFMKDVKVTYVQSKLGQSKLENAKNCRASEEAIDYVIFEYEDYLYAQNSEIQLAIHQKNKEVAEKLKQDYKEKMLCVVSQSYEYIKINIVENSPKKIQEMDYQWFYFQQLTKENGEVLHWQKFHRQEKNINNKYFIPAP